ncbi:hypothetical protein K1719_023512 [Acacia pycnantha]|nr:hypothetical protein K1719_023512 [Acacia pycnantha]
MNNIMFWNCRGACGSNLYENVRLVCGNFFPSVIILAETKCDEEARFSCLSSLGYDGRSFSPSVGRSGGMVVVWRSDRITVSVLQVDRQFIHLCCTNRIGVTFLLTAIYALPSENSKRVLWEELRKLSLSISRPWVVLGDFNDVLYPSERTGGARGSVRRMNLFFERLQGCRLSDLGFLGPRFTWKGPCLPGGRRLFERLDRAVGNEAFLMEHSGCSVRVLQRTRFSDHNPISLQ